MHKIALFILICGLVSAGWSPQPSRLIDWSATRKLTWNDFLGRPDHSNNNAALTSSNINFSFGYGSAGFRYSISCRFDKRKSWVRLRTDYVLAHEQGHFDIAEIYARKLNKALKEYRYREATVSRDLNILYDRLVKEHHEMQARYDRETNHSRNKTQQALWLKKIASQLKQLQPYADYPRSSNEN